MDSAEQSAKFKAKLGAPFPFIPDPNGEIVARYGVKYPIVKLAMRVTFVVGPDGRILEVKKGLDALDPSKAIVACELPKRT